jgi:DNA-binding protein
MNETPSPPTPVRHAAGSREDADRAAGPGAPRSPPADGFPGRARVPRAEPVVYVGNKPTMTYVFEVLGQINSGVPEVTVRARGNAISKAVDVAEVARRHRLLTTGVEVGPIRISTERLTNKEGREVPVSVIEIVLKRLPGPAPGVPPGASPTSPP